jgi:ribosomal protein S18 acetylase RimI-like enzyme
MAIHIRRAVEQDYEGYCNLFYEINELHRQALPEIFQQPAGSIIEKEYFLSLLNDKQVAIFLACQSSTGQPVGFVVVAVHESPHYPVLTPRRFAVLDTLAVSPAFHRTGVGRALMQQAEEWAVGQGVSEVELNVYEFNLGAQAFYRQLGYTTHSRKMSKKLRDK